MPAPAAAGVLDWEAEKRRILAALEASEGSQGHEAGPERLQIQQIVAQTERLLAEKDRQIEELRQSASAAAAGAAAVGATAAAREEILDQDALIRQERDNLQRLQDEWREKLRQAEVDLSVQRAKVARQQADVNEKLRQVEPGGPGASSAKTPEKPAARPLAEPARPGRRRSAAGQTGLGRGGFYFLPGSPRCLRTIALSSSTWRRRSCTWPRSSWMAGSGRTFDCTGRLAGHQTAQVVHEGLAWPLLHPGLPANLLQHLVGFCGLVLVDRGLLGLAFLGQLLGLFHQGFHAPLEGLAAGVGAGTRFSGVPGSAPPGWTCTQPPPLRIISRRCTSGVPGTAGTSPAVGPRRPPAFPISRGPRPYWPPPRLAASGRAARPVRPIGAGD